MWNPFPSPAWYHVSALFISHSPFQPAESFTVPLTFQAPSSPRPQSHGIPPAWHTLPSLGKLLLVLLISLGITPHSPVAYPGSWDEVNAPPGGSRAPLPHSWHYLYFVVIIYSHAWLSLKNVTSITYRGPVHSVLLTGLGVWIIQLFEGTSTFGASLCNPYLLYKRNLSPEI